MAGIRPAGIDLKALALSRAANKPGAVVVNFERDGFDIVVVANGIPTILHSVTTASESVTEEDKVQKLIAELTRTIDFYNITHAASQTEPDMPVVLTGDMASSASTVELIQAGIGHPVESLNSGLQSPPDFPAAAYASNIGLALKMGGKTCSPKNTALYHDINLDLLGGKRRLEERREATSTRVYPVALIAGVALLLFLSVISTRAQGETVRLNNEVLLLDTELTRTRVKADELVSVESEISRLQSETQNLKLTQQTDLGKNVNDADSLYFYRRYPATGRVRLN